jgi:spermidine/putrescine transport system permease protein
MKVDRANPLWRFHGITPMTIFFFAYLYLPIIVLLVLSFNENRLATIWTGFSTKWYSVVLGNDNILRAAKNSLVIGLSATVLATFAATLAAMGMARGRFRGEGGVAAMLTLPLLVPEIVTAIATLLFFIVIGVKLGLISIIVAHTVFCIPFAYLPIRARLEGMDPALIEAANDLYANEWQAFKRITFPLLWPGILSGAMLSFIISLDDFVISYFVGGAGSTTLPIYIFGMIRIGITPEVNAVSALMLIISILFVSISFLIDRIRY